uniref:THAP-type domain-containing protein n=1 Tax=Timema tahoe TaxID=61484 RepID=A0A7R9P2A0_9NEOP|nr:unnamed protein product [Timema tahoe]
MYGGKPFGKKWAFGTPKAHSITQGHDVKRIEREDVNAKWIAACKRKRRINIKNARICSIHFGPESFTKSRAQMMLNYSPEKCRKLKDNSVPLLHLPLKEHKNQDNQRSERYKKKERKNLVREILATASTNSCVINKQELPVLSEESEKCPKERSTFLQPEFGPINCKSPSNDLLNLNDRYLK